MNDQSTQGLPPNGRLISAGMAVAAAMGLLANHFAVGSQNVAYLMILCLGPIALFLGIGGVVEPKILWSVGKYGKNLPVVYKIIGAALGRLGRRGNDSLASVRLPTRITSLRHATIYARRPDCRGHVVAEVATS